MHVSVTSHRDPEPLDLEAFERLAAFVLRMEEVPAHAELSVALVSDEEMTGLNERYRGTEGPTDVLSFGCDDPCPADSDDPIAIGDVIIAPGVAERQAADAGVTVEEEFNLLLVHGILHILGYTHDAAEDSKAMEEREASLLSAWADHG